MKVLVLIGEGRALEQAQRTAQACGLDHVVVALESPDRYNFDLGALHASHPTATTDVFVALDERAVNQSRHKLLADVRLAGYGSINLVWPQAHVDAGVRLLGNVHIGPGCNIAADSSIGPGAWLERQVIVEQEARIGACVTLHAGVHLGRDTQIGQGSTLGGGSMTRSGARIGRHCEWLLPGTVPDVLPDRCFYDALMPGGARILR
ncbi:MULTISPECIES: LbetaH domain-containing protein [unclassified Xanthomonas]|uniref:acetyltransferase n=1 Tax=Xanthomonas sp. LMG 9002 TaxID=1591158 RepID=UPI00136A384C|nr:acetyltransferase [Xanthomonas sp. LMG 9002]MXV07416.1 acetyltransferase [Xanthomonas sp. LMG 9002]